VKFLSLFDAGNDGFGIVKEKGSIATMENLVGIGSSVSTIMDRRSSCGDMPRHLEGGRIKSRDRTNR